MKSLLVITVTILAWVVGMGFGQGPAFAQSTGDPPNIGLGLTLDKSVYYPYELIMVTLSVSSDSAEDVIITKGFKATEFYLFLRFYDEKDRVITSDVLVASTLTPPPPRVFPDGSGALPQGALVEIVEDDWVLSFDPFDAYTNYPLEGRSGRFWVKAMVGTRTYYNYLETATGTKYALTYPEIDDETKWYGSLESNPAPFTIVGDADGDTYYYPEAHDGRPADCDDSNPNVHPGATEMPGDGIDNDCDPATPDVALVETGMVDVTAHRHIVGTGTHPGSTKEPLVGVPLRVYSKAAGSCSSDYGVSWQHYSTIWRSCDRPDGQGTTGTDGTAQITVPVGNHILIGRYDPDPETYGDEIYMGVSVGQVDVNARVDKYLQLIENSKNEKVPAKYRKVKGSELLIIEPEYVEWDGTEELYPFIFESVGDWAVTTSVTPPEGFVADTESLSEDVNTELEAVQFTITDVGSKWTGTEVEYELKHKGKKDKLKSRVGVKLTKKLAKKKGLDIYGNPKK